MIRVLVAALALGGLGVAPAPAAVSPARLLSTYAPTVVLHSSERFAPAEVQGFVSAAALQRRAPDGTWQPVRDPLPQLPSAGAGWRLDVRNCTPQVGVASIECYAAVPETPPVVYGRVETFRDRILLQYWLWYVYDFWSGLFPPSDFLWQAHEGDWEAVTVVLTRAQRPLYAAYSQHCSGVRRTWARVPKERGTHPLVYAALGSHSNWLGPGLHRIDTRCYPQIARAIFGAYLPQVLDYTGGGVRLRPPVQRVTAASPSWMRFPGDWGEEQWFHAPDPVNTVPFGTSARGPAFHSLWVTPFREMLGWPLG